MSPEMTEKPHGKGQTEDLAFVSESVLGNMNMRTKEFYLYLLRGIF